MEITAAVLENPGGEFVLQTLELEQPRPDEVLVKIQGAGICHTDIAVRDSFFPVPLPVVLGHEGAGVIEKVGSAVTSLEVGDHVVLTVDKCGHCTNCHSGKPTYCSNLYETNFSGARKDGSSPLSRGGKPINGVFFNQSSFATHAIANERNTVKVPKDVPLSLLGPLGCGVQTGAGTVLNSLKPPPGSSIVIYGAGAVGLSAMMAAVLAGCSPVIMVDINEERLKFALELGADKVINSLEKDPVTEITAYTRGGTDFAIESSGVPKVLRAAVESTHPLGVCGLVGAAAFGSEVTLDVASIFFGRTVKGVLEGDSVPKVFIPQMVEFFKSGELPFDRLVKFYDFDQINQAVHDSDKTGVAIKPVLRIA